MGSRLRIALIGLGMVAQTHVKAILDLQDESQGAVSLCGVLSRDTQRAANFVAQTCGQHASNIQIYQTASEIAADPKVDIVAICTPPNARSELVETLAAAGKHILMEKPIERTLAAATRIVETCEQRQVQLGIFLQHRMRASAQQMRKVLHENTLGQIALVEICVPWWRQQSYYDEPGRGTYTRDGGGVLISQSIHTLDLALSLLGPVTKVQAMARTTALHQMEAEDFVSAGLEFANGAIGSLVASTASFPGATESIVVHGTLGSAKLISGQLELTLQDGSHESFGEQSGTGGGADPMAFTHTWHQAIVSDFVDALQANRAPAVSGRDALAVHALIEALIQSSNEERAITLPGIAEGKL